MNWMDTSTTIYARLLYLYPVSVRHNDGDAMMQIFRDLARKELRMGITGLVRLWLRTGIDLLKSVPESYLRNSHEPAGHAARRLAMIYVLCVLAFVAYGAIGFGEYYTRPSWSVDLHAGTAVNENDILRLAETAAPQYNSYVRYWQFGGLTLTILLGVCAAMFARWQKSLGHGLGALAIGAVATSAALHLMPFRYFAFDQYPLGFLWLFQLPLTVGCFLVTLFVFRSSFFVTRVHA